MDPNYDPDACSSTDVSPPSDWGDLAEVVSDDEMVGVVAPKRKAGMIRDLPASEHLIRDTINQMSREKTFSLS